MEPIDDNDVDKIFLQMRQELQKLDSEKDEQEKNQQGKTVSFHPGFKLTVPNDFVESGQEKAATIFFSQNRPERVLVNSLDHAGLTFQTAKKDKEGTKIVLENEREHMRQILRQSDGKSVFYEEGTIEAKIPVVWFDYKSFASDERVYNMLFLFQVNGKLIIGTFYCIFKDYDRWKPRILNMLQTIQITEEESWENITLRQNL